MIEADGGTVEQKRGKMRFKSFLKFVLGSVLFFFLSAMLLPFQLS